MSETTEDKAARAYRNSESAASLTRKRRIQARPAGAPGRATREMRQVVRVV